MTISADQHIVLEKSTPKKDATVGTGDPIDVDDDSMAFWANGIAAPQFTTQTIGTFRKLVDTAKDLAKKPAAGDLVVSGPIGASDNQVAFAAPGAGEVGVYVGANLYSNGQTHFIDRTFKRLRERWLELAKDGAA